MYIDLGEVGAEDNGAVRSTTAEAAIAKANQILSPHPGYKRSCDDSPLIPIDRRRVPPSDGAGSARKSIRPAVRQYLKPLHKARYEKAHAGAGELPGDQLHSSLAGGNPPQVGIAGDGVVMPALVAAAPPFVPYPALFGLVFTLQKVAVISSWQITPVSVSGELFVAPPAPNG